ncbi:MAG: hypothetical protein CNLJKLNK_01273 [Holosporales bacterium]
MYYTVYISTLQEAHMLSVRVSQDLEHRLEALAKKTHRSKGYFVKQALERYLEDEEDLADAVIAYEEFLRQNEPGFSLEDMKKRYNIDV